MNILILSTWFPTPPDNGSRIRICYQLQALSQAHQVTVLAFNPEGATAFPLLCTHPMGQPVSLQSVPVDPFRYVHAPSCLKFASPTPLACWPSRMMWQQVAQAAQLERWDVVVAGQLPALPYLRLLPNVPALLDMDTSWSCQAHTRFQGVPHGWRRLRLWLSWYKAALYERYWLLRLAACTVASTLEQDYLRRLVPRHASRIQLCENGVDCWHNHPGLVRRQPHTLVYQGALTYSANYDAMQYFLRDIYPLIQTQEPAVRLIITGANTDVNLAGLRLDESVHLTGYIADVRQPVAAASACVVPLRQGGGTRLKVLEAMALGTPVVATSKAVEGLSLVAGKHFLLADEPAAFAQAVIQLLRHPALAEHLAGAAREWVAARYDWTQIGRHFVAVVEQAAGRQAAWQTA